jgi:hypothetical protein
VAFLSLHLYEGIKTHFGKRRRRKIMKGGLKIIDNLGKENHRKETISKTQVSNRSKFLSCCSLDKK